MTALVELCCGTAAVSLAALGAPRFPASRIGNKAGYAREILGHMGIEPGSVRQALLIDADPEMIRILTALLNMPGTLAEMVRELLSKGDPRTVWERAREGTSSASALIRIAGARGGIGGFRGEHKLRPTATGIPFSLVDRIRKFQRFKKKNWSMLSNVHCQTATLDEFFQHRYLTKPNARIYIDPPYEGRQGFAGFVLAEVIEDTARRLAYAGHPVWVSEARPLHGAKVRVNITQARQGQSRRSLTTSLEEWLNFYPPR